MDSLSCIPALNKPSVLTALREELPAYLDKASDVSPTISYGETIFFIECFIWSLPSKYIRRLFRSCN